MRLIEKKDNLNICLSSLLLNDQKHLLNEQKNVLLTSISEVIHKKTNHKQAIVFIDRYKTDVNLYTKFLTDYLKAYIARRKKQPKFTGYGGKLFGYSGPVKVAAAEAFLQLITSAQPNNDLIKPHYCALNRGELSDIYSRLSST